ncbi:hypothetical protein SUGI_0236750, partial [Cryptomeria japonica]
MALVDSYVFRIQSSKYLPGRGTNGIGYLCLETNFCAGRRIPRLILAASMRFFSDQNAIDSASAGKYHAAWQSLEEERWEGELEVDGNIPNWL